MFSKDHLVWVRTIYLYLATFLGLIFIVIGASNLANRFLITYVFPVNYYGFNGYYDCQVKPDGTGTTMTDTEKTACKTNLEEQNKLNSQNDANREFAWSLSMLLVGVPLFVGHWRIVRKEK